MDSGTNVITKEDFNNVVPKRQRQTKLKSSSLKLTAFGGHDIPVIGKCTHKSLVNGTSQILKFQVVEMGNSLLGCEDCKKLKLVTFNVNDIRKDPNDSVIGQKNEDICKKYADCFECLGPMSEPYHIKINKDAAPVIHSTRKVIAALRERVRKELEEMESQGVIKKVQEPTEWVNSMVINEKRSGKLRICIDPRDLNKVISREHYQLPTQEEITARLAGAKYFSHLHAKSSFWQMPLDKESSYLTTFNAQFGRYIFTVIPFGVVFAQEVFHRTVTELFADIDGCETDIDDILVWGKTLEEHDHNLKMTLDHVRKVKMTLNREKCKFRQTELIYLGEELTAGGVKPDDVKMKAIQEYTRPESKQDVLRLLGMVNFIAKFAPKVSDFTAPLRELIKKNVEFHWLDHHKKAFQDLKKLLTGPEALRYYDETKPITLKIDASQKGLE